MQDRIRFEVVEVFQCGGQVAQSPPGVELFKVLGVGILIQLCHQRRECPLVGKLHYDAEVGPFLVASVVLDDALMVNFSQ